LAVSGLLGLPPILTYADTVLYNFHGASSSSALSLAANPPTYTLASFTNTRSEQQFYIISALCEIAGSEALRLMRRSLDELFLADQTALRRLTTYLKKLAVQIDRIGDITLSIMKEVDPEEFYHLIRPWFKGGDSEGPESLGWLFLGADDQAHAAENANRGNRKGRMFSGPSAGQSSLIHAIDIFLTVDHSPTEEEIVLAQQLAVPQLHLNHSPVAGDTEPPATPAPVISKRTNNEASFVERMLQYMPLPHRTFLLHLSTHPTPLRPLVIAHAQSHPQLAAAYDSALEALKRFREKHMRVVSMFIVQQARRKPSPRIRKILGQEVDQDEVEDVVADVAEKGELRGTGGTPLFKFLKRCRDNTTKAMIGKSAGPTYELE
jgi:indoleamine 2,3-dioxygenase